MIKKRKNKRKKAAKMEKKINLIYLRKIKIIKLRIVRVLNLKLFVRITMKNRFQKQIKILLKVNFQLELLSEFWYFLELI